MTPELVRQTLQVLEECAQATRTHEYLIGTLTVPLADESRGEIAEGLAITATKLENLRKEILLAD